MDNMKKLALGNAMGMKKRALGNAMGNINNLAIEDAYGDSPLPPFL